MAETDHVSDGESLVVKRKGGGSIVSHPPVFSPDAKILYIVWGNCIRAYSTQTGDFLQEFEGLSHRSTGVQLIHDTEILATCSEKGEIIFWSRKSAVLQEKREIPIAPSTNIIGFHFLGKEKDFYVMTKNVDRQKMLRFTSSGKDFKEVNIEFNRSPRCYSFGGIKGGEYLGAICRNDLYVMDLKKGKILRHKIAADRYFTCITAHPSEQILATGDQTGCILVWRSFFEKSHPPKSVYHWHTLPVSDITFSQAGSSMYSGGGECVMVKWTLDFQQKKFLPRMGAPLRYLVVAPDNLFVAASLDDNSIQLVDPQGQIKKVIQNFTWNVNINSGLPGQEGIQKMRYDPKTKSLVLNGQSGHLQFFLASSNSLLYNLDVVGQNYLTQERNSIIYNTEVTHVAFSCNGNWMATVEQRKDPEASLEARLKFWKFSEEKQNFCLNTSIENPHVGEIFALEMKPGTEDSLNIMAVTSGADKKFKMWNLVDCSSNDDRKDDRSSNQECWQCEGVGLYKGLSAGDFGFSSDGSILGAAFSHALTLWVPETSELKSGLSHPNYQHEIRKVQFGNGDCSHLVVCALPGCLIVWNLLSLTMTWTVPIEVNILVADILSSFMAAFTHDGDLIVFKPSDPQPVLIKPNISQNKILHAVFVPMSESRPDLMKWQQKSQLYFMNHYQEVLVLENPDDCFREGAGGGIQGNPDDGKLLSLTPFGRMLAGVSLISDVIPTTTSDYTSVGIPGDREVEEFMRTPAHTMPPLRTVCYSFLASLIRRPRNKLKDEDALSEIEETKDKDDDSDSGHDSDGGKDSSEGEKGQYSDKRASQDSECKFYRPRIESTPELEAQLEKVLYESTDWVEALI